MPLARRGVLSLLLAFPLFCQQRPDVRTTVQLVLIPTSVTDVSGNPVEGLEAGDFQVLADGKVIPHELEAVGQPLALAVAVSIDEVSGPALAKVIKAAPMVQPLLAGERGMAAVFSYSDTAQMVQPLTGNYEEVVEAFSKLRPKGTHVAMLDAVLAATETLEQRSVKSRRVLLLIGHSRDQGSTARVEDVLTRLQRANITVYALTASPTRTAFTTKRSERIGKETDPTNVPAYQVGKREFDLLPLFRGLGHMGKPTTAQLLTDFTGGTSQAFVKQDALEKVIQQASLDLHSHYLLTITVPGDAGLRFHPLEVRVQRPKVTVRARCGYLGLPGPE